MCFEFKKSRTPSRERLLDSYRKEQHSEKASKKARLDERNDGPAHRNHNSKGRFAIYEHIVHI